MNESDRARQAALEGTYLAPKRRASSRGWQGAGAAAVGAGVVLAKFKGVLFFLLNFKWIAIGLKLGLSSLTFFASVWFYALFWGWKFAAVFTVLILIHELGHAFFMRFFGVPASMPYFIPGFGALITMKGRPASALQESFIALGGPLLGTVGALCCFFYGVATQNHFWLACAYTGFFLNLFNMFPVMPLDGGRIVGAISPRIWIFGLVLMIVAAIAFHWWNPLIIVLIVLSVPAMIAAWRGNVDPNYYALSAGQRAAVAVAYFALAALLFVSMLASRVPAPGHPLVS